MTRLYKITIKRSAVNKQWWWSIVHWNGKQICRSSETYRRKFDCVGALEKMLFAIEESQYETEIG